jgi:hypothetical protein
VNVFTPDPTALAGGHAGNLLAKVLDRAHRFVSMLEVGKPDLLARHNTSVIVSTMQEA